MHTLITKIHTSLQLCYIAAHSNIKPNEVADSAVNKAALKPSIDLLLFSELTEFQHDFHSHIHLL